MIAARAHVACVSNGPRHYQAFLIGPMPDNMCALCGCEFSAVRVFCGVLRVSLCAHCRREVEQRAVAGNTQPNPVEWSEVHG